MRDVPLVFSSAPLSYCMIYLAELCSFFQFCCLIDHDVAEVAQWFKVGGLTGHSQGVICAVVVAMAKSQEHFVETALKFLTYMFYHGVRVQQVYPIKQLPAKGQSRGRELASAVTSAAC
jgi:malonyl CoA-acyl carrier protein transacylase